MKHNKYQWSYSFDYSWNLKGVKRLSKTSVLIFAENGFVIFDLNSLVVPF